MALEEKLRDDIKDEYKWDLSKIYSSKEDWQKDFDVVKEEILKIKDYKDNFLKDGKNFYEFLKYDENVSRRLEKTKD